MTNAKIISDGLPRYLLSICIPTYQRSDDLRRCLSSIFSLERNIVEKIQVCVSDNCSDYDFQGLIDLFKMNNNLFYRINEKNIGFDRNLLEVISMATGEYIMLLGNDDIVLEDGIIKLLDNLIKISPDVVFSNYRITRSDNSGSYNVYKFNQIMTGLKLEWILANLKEKCTFISAITIKKKCLEIDDNILQRFIGKNFIHMVLVLEGLRGSQNILYFPDATTSASDKNKTVYDIKQVFLMDLGYIINSYDKIYDIKSIIKFKLGTLRHVVFSGEKVTIGDIILFKCLNLSSLLLYFLSKIKYAEKNKYYVELLLIMLPTCDN